jgi:RHS repeat-associated protein
VPVAGVIVLAREDFDRNLRSALGDQPDDRASGAPVDERTLVRAAELAGDANVPGVIGMAARRAEGRQREFAGSVFVVADTVEADPTSDRIVVTSFDVVAVELRGAASWMGVDLKLSTGRGPSGGPAGGGPGNAQPGRCCGPSTICVTPPGDNPPGGPISRLTISDRVAVSGAIGAPGVPRDPGTFYTAGDYGTRAAGGGAPVRVFAVDAYAGAVGMVDPDVWPPGVPTPVAMDCVRVVDKGCAAVRPVCNEGDIGYTQDDDGSASIAVGSNPCGAPSERPVRANDVPELCTHIFGPETLPEECGGNGGSLSMPWATVSSLPKLCTVAKVAPGATGPCNPQSQAMRELDLRRKAGWSPGSTARSCQPLAKGGEYCVECDKQGNCNEQLLVPKLDPTIAGDQSEETGTGVTETRPDVWPTPEPAPVVPPDSAPPRKPLVHVEPASTTPPGPPPVSSSAPREPPLVVTDPFCPGVKPSDTVSQPTTVADPVNLSDGALHLSHVDLSFPGPVRALEFARTYSSTSRDRSPLGSNWRHGWDERLEPLRPDTAPDWLSPWAAGGDDVTTAVLHHRGDGGSDVYLYDAITALYLPQAGSVATLARMGGGWALRDPNGRIRIFDGLGYLTADRDRFGNQFTLDYEPTPLGRLFDAHCAAAQLTARNETLSHRRNTLLAYLVGASARPPADLPSWTVTAADFGPPFDAWPTDRDERAALEYARDYLLYLVSLGALPESIDGARRRRLRTVTDPVGRTLSFSYVTATSWDPQAPSPVAFAAHPGAGLIRRVEGPEATTVGFDYAQPASYPPALNEQFLVSVRRRNGAPTGSALRAARARSYQFTYNWPGGPVESFPAHVGGVEQAYGTYFKTFVGCAYPATVSCLSGAKGTVPRFNAGDPLDLARRAAEAYVSDVADDIIEVLVDGRPESETRYRVDPDDDSFGRVVAQRFGSSTARGPISIVPPDLPGENWTSALPKAVLEWVDAGPTMLDASGQAAAERSELSLPTAIRERYPLEGAPAPVAPPPPKNLPPMPGRCDLDSTRERARQLPGWRPSVAYYDAPRPRRPRVPPVSELRRTWLTRDQLIAAQVGDPTHNDLSYEVAPNPADTLTVIVSRLVGRRHLVAANANRICQWVKMTDRDALVSWRGLNYRGQQLVLAEADFAGTYRFSEWRYNADGLVVEHRPAALAGQRAARTISWTYDEIDPNGQAGWNEWLPAFWARRQNVLRTELALDGPVAVDDLETGQSTASATSPLSAPTAGRYRTTTWDPLFNQPLRTEAGSLRLTGPPRRRRRVDVPQQRFDYVYDYQELSLKVPDDDAGSLSGLLEALRGWGFAWLRNDPEAMAWQLPPALLGTDVNGDGALGNRFAASTAAGAPPLDPALVAARRAVGAPVAIINSRPGIADSKRVWTYSWAPHGLPGRVTGPDGDDVRHEYYPVDRAAPAGAFGDPDQLGPVLLAHVGNRGMLARTATGTHRPGRPETGPEVKPSPLNGPYRWLPVSGLAPASSAAEVHAALGDLALPEEMITDLLATLTFDPAVEPEGAREIVTFAYNAAGHLASTDSLTGRTSQITDTDGRVLSRRDAAGTTVTTEWNSFGNPVAGRTAAATGPAAEWAAEYDEEGRVVYHCQAVVPGGVADPANGQGLEQRWKYLPEGELAAHTNPAGVTSERELDGWGRLISETSMAVGTADRRIANWSRDVDDRPEALRLGGVPAAGLPNLTESWAYDSLGRLAGHTDRRGTGWQFAWSARGAQVRRALASSAAQQPDWEEVTDHDWWGLPTRTTVSGPKTGAAPAPRSVTAVREWTSGGRLSTEALDGYATSRFASDLTGRVVWEESPDGVQTVRTFSHTPHRRCEAQLWAAADGTRRCRATITDLDPRDLPVLLTQVAQDAGQRNPAHRISTQREYDAIGRLVVEIGPLAERTERSWDWAGRMTQERVSRAPGGPVDTTHFTWTPDGQLATRTDPDGQATVVTYNPLSEVIDVVIAGVHRTITRDRLGRISTINDGVSTLRTTYSDTAGTPLGDPVLEELETPAGWVETTRRDYDAIGRPRSIEVRNLGLGSIAEADRTVRTQWEHDHLGRITLEVTNVGVCPPIAARTFWSQRPTGGWERQRTLDCAAATSSISDLLDGARRLTSRAVNNAAPVTFDWEGQTYRGRRQPQPAWASPLVEAIELDPFGLATTTTWRAIELDAAGVPVSAADAARWAPAGSDQTLLTAPLLELRQATDALGRAVSRWSRTASPAAGAKTRWRGVSYDGRRRLDQCWEADTGTKPPALTPYAADAAAVEAAAPAGTQPWMYGRDTISGDLESIKDGNGTRFALSTPRTPGHRLTGVDVGTEAVTVAHDGAARIKSIADPAGVQTLRWHPGSQLAAVDHGGVQVAGFLYDGLGRLVGVINRGEKTAGRLHGFDGDDLIAAYDHTGVAQWQAVWGPTGLIEHRDLVTATTALPLLDPLGSPVAVWQPATGTLAGTLSWTPEGRATVYGPNGAVQCAPDHTGALCPIPGGIEFGFTGSWQSAPTGLVWMRARWYSPALAQFLSPDPLGFIDGPNLYAYAAGDPVNRIDPLGLGSTGPAKSTGGPIGGRGGGPSAPPTGGQPTPIQLAAIVPWRLLAQILLELVRAGSVSGKSRPPREPVPIERRIRKPAPPPKPPLDGPKPPGDDDDDKGPPSGTVPTEAPSPTPAPAPPVPPGPAEQQSEIDWGTVLLATGAGVVGTIIFFASGGGLGLAPESAPASGLLLTPGPSSQFGDGLQMMQ